MNTLTTAPRS